MTIIQKNIEAKRLVELLNNCGVEIEINNEFIRLRQATLVDWSKTVKIVSDKGRIFSKPQDQLITVKYVIEDILLPDQPIKEEILPAAKEEIQVEQVIEEPKEEIEETIESLESDPVKRSLWQKIKGIFQKS
jgi:hypothetical protein